MRNKHLPLITLFAAALCFIVWLGLIPAALPSADAQAPAPTPDVANGMRIFSERCANCHGDTGQGDGALAAQGSFEPANFTAPNYLQQANPSHLFDVISNGNIAKGMPPFGETSSSPLSVAERWDLIAAIYALGADPQMIVDGEALYLASCAQCHGAEGMGNASAAPPIPSLATADIWQTSSNNDIVATLTSSDSPAHDLPLDDTEWHAVTAYARTLHFGYALPPAAPITVNDVSVTGQVWNASQNAAASNTLTASLGVYTLDLERAYAYTTTLSADGSYAINVPQVQSDWLFIVTVSINGLDFVSNVAQLPIGSQTLDLPVTIYDQTDDASGVMIDEIQIILELKEGSLRINEIYRVSNTRPYVYNPPAGSFEISLPAGAQDVSFSRGRNNFSDVVAATEVVPTETGWINTRPLYPGQGTLDLVAHYSLPYNGDSLTVAHPIHYTAALVSLGVPNVGISVVEENGWSQRGERVVQGQSYLDYERGLLLSDTPLTYQLTGSAKIVQDAQGNLITQRNESQELLIGGGVLALVLCAAALLLIRQNRSTADATTTKNRDALLHAIAQLDNEHEAGSLSTEAYTTQRNALREQLHALWPKK